MSKSVKKIVGVAVAVAIPFVAPAISTAIGLSTAIGSTAGAAVVGAGLGAANAALVTGGDIGRGALMGGISGGISGYMQGASPTTAEVVGASSAAQPTQQAQMLAAQEAGFGVNQSLASGNALAYAAPTALPSQQAAMLAAQQAEFGYGPMANTAVGYQSPYALGQAYTTPVDVGYDIGGTQYQLSQASAAPTGTTGTSPGYFPSAEQSVVGGAPTTYGGAGTGVTGPTAGLAPPTYAPPAAPPAAPAAAPAAPTYETPLSGASEVAAGGALQEPPTTFGEALTRVPGAIADKFKDPNALADLTLRAAGMLAGSALAGEGLSEEEMALLEARAEELRELQATNRALFEQQLSQAQEFMGESKYFDPEYFGLQRARRAQIAGARAKKAGLRGLTGAAREAEERRYDIETGRSVGTAFDVGYNTAVQGRLGTMQAGLQAMPSYMTEVTTSPIATQYAGLQDAAARRRQTQSDIGNLFGSLTGRA